MTPKPTLLHTAFINKMLAQMIIPLWIWIFWKVMGYNSVVELLLYMCIGFDSNHHENRNKPTHSYPVMQNTQPRHKTLAIA